MHSKQLLAIALALAAIIAAADGLSLFGKSKKNKNKNRGSGGDDDDEQHPPETPEEHLAVLRAAHDELLAQDPDAVNKVGYLVKYVAEQLDTTEHWLYGADELTMAKWTLQKQYLTIGDEEALYYALHDAARDDPNFMYVYHNNIEPYQDAPAVYELFDRGIVEPCRRYSAKVADIIQFALNDQGSRDELMEDLTFVRALAADHMCKVLDQNENSARVTFLNAVAARSRAN